MSDAVAFVGDPSADGDLDGLEALMEHALGTSDSMPDGSPGLSFDASGHLVFEYTRNLAADDMIYEVHVSTDLVSWVDASADFGLGGEDALGGGRTAVVLRSLAAASGLRQFVRLQVRSR